MYDVAIIGTGAAGVSAALTLKAFRRNIVWFGSGKLSEKIGRAEEIRNYPGLSAVSGEEMRKAFLKQTEEMGIGITDKQVTGVYPMDGKFGILCNREEFEAKSVILCTGVESVKPIKGELEFLGRGVSYCALCDGFLYKNKKIAVLCTSKALEEEIEYLADLAAEVYLIPLYKNVEIERDNVTVLSGMPSEIVGSRKAEGIVLRGERIAVDGVFMLKSAVAPAVLVPGLVCEQGHVAVNREMETNLQGCFAAGDCTGRPYQYAKAVGEGNVAAHSANAYLAALSKGESEGK